MKTTHIRRESGSSLIVVISVLATLMVVVAVAAEYTNTVNRHVQRSGSLQNAISAGDACIELLYSNWRQICSNTPMVAMKTSDFATLPTPLPTELNLPTRTNFVKRGLGINPDVDELDTNYTISNYKVVATNAEWGALASATTVPEAMLGRLDAPITSGTPTPTTPAVFNYVASADVTLPALGKDGYIVAKVRRVFQKQQMSPWNFAIFYNDPLEIHPGPNLIVSGWVHTNSDLYTGHNSLTFANKVTYGSDWFVGFDPKETSHDAYDAKGYRAVPKAPNTPTNLPPARDQALQPFGLDPKAIFNSDVANPNNDNYHELVDVPVINPATGLRYSDPLQGERYYDQAGIKIDVGTTPPTVQRWDGTKVYSSSSGDDKKLYNAVVLALSTTPAVNMQDAREGVLVRVTTLDIKSIKDSVDANDIKNSGGKTRWNNIIYINDSSATSANRRGIRLKNGQVLPDNGLSVASANPVYIQGDYNTGSGTPPSNYTGAANDPTQPESIGYNRQPSSVLADAVNILSNNWDDSNAGSALNARAATNTTVNTAIVSGIVPSSAAFTGQNSYSGGAENFPRFLEDWSNVKFTYYGSMVELYNSQQAVGRWGTGGVYGAPTRQWYFDNNFKITPPPGSLMLYSYIKGKWSVY